MKLSRTPADQSAKPINNNTGLGGLPSDFSTLFEYMSLAEIRRGAGAKPTFIFNNGDDAILVRQHHGVLEAAFQVNGYTNPRGVAAPLLWPFARPAPYAASPFRPLSRTEAGVLSSNIEETLGILDTISYQAFKPDAGKLAQLMRQASELRVNGDVFERA